MVDVQKLHFDHEKQSDYSFYLIDEYKYSNPTVYYKTFCIAENVGSIYTVSPDGMLNTHH
jgi:hypothetical protein